MKIAVLSDIHSNHIALRTCLDYALNRGINHYLLLGDYAGDCPYPQQTMEILYELIEKYECWFIRGNREEYMLDYRARGEDGWYYSSSCGCLQYTYENLTKRDLDFFAKLDNKGKLELEGLPPFEFCHGSLESSRELLHKGKENTVKVLQRLETNLLLCGHTHEQGTFEYENKKIVNPGSVGVPFSYNGNTQFAILHSDGEAWQEEYIQLVYDLESVLEEYKLCGLDWKAPMWTVLTKEYLKTGIDKTSIGLIRAMELCRKETGEANWPDIPEKYWEEAVLEIEIEIDK